MATVLYGSRYIGDVDPALSEVVPAGFEWRQTGDVNKLWERDSTGAVWVEIGNPDLPNYGLASLDGFTVAGEITGPSGLASLADADFGALAVGGKAVAPKDYVDTQIAALLKTMNKRIQATLLSQGAGIGVSGNIAKKQGHYASGLDVSTPRTFTIPQPTFSDGQVADYAQCIWGAWIEVWSIGGQSDPAHAIFISVDSTSDTVPNYTITGGQDDHAFPTYVVVGWFILGFRNG